jgi:hypothetical protein
MPTPQELIQRLRALDPSFQQACYQQAPHVSEQLLEFATQGMQVLQGLAGVLGCLHMGATIAQQMRLAPPAPPVHPVVATMRALPQYEALMTPRQPFIPVNGSARPRVADWSVLG